MLCHRHAYDHHFLAKSRETGPIITACLHKKGTTGLSAALGLYMCRNDIGTVTEIQIPELVNNDIRNRAVSLNKTTFLSLAWLFQSTRQCSVHVLAVSSSSLKCTTSLST